MTTYFIRVDTRLDPYWCHWLGAERLTQHRDGTTTLVASVGEPAALYRILAQISDLGVTLVLVQRAGRRPPLQRHRRK